MPTVIHLRSSVVSYLRLVVLVVLFVLLGTGMWLAIGKPALDRSEAERTSVLRQFGCSVETMHTSHSLLFGQSPGSFWRCDGKAIHEQLANVLVVEHRRGENKTWEALRQVK